MRLFTTIIILAGFISQLTGCGACQRVAAHRAAFLEAQKDIVSDREHQIILQIPKSLIDSTVKSAERKVSAVSFRMPGLGDLSRYVGRLSLDPKDISVDVDRKQAIRLSVLLNVKYNRRGLFDLRLTAEAPVKYNEKTGVMEIVVRHDLFKTVEPVPSKNAVNSLAKALRSELPRLARPLFPLSAVKTGARRAIAALSRDVYGLIRRDVLTPMGEMVRFRFQLPKIPIERVSLRSGAHGWAIGLRTSLPGDGIQASLQSVPSRRVRVSVSTPMLASLGNWGMSTGALPSTFDQKGKARKDGPYVAALGWRKDTRPMQVQLWTRAPETAGLCIYARAAGTPGIKLARKRLKISFEKAQIEALDGPPLLNSAAAILGISRRSFGFTKELALQNEIRLGSQSLGLTLKSASIDSEVLQFEFLTESGKSKKQRKARSGS